MPVPNNRYTFFTATSVAQTVVAANPDRRRLNIYSYARPEETDPNSIWVNDSSAPAVAFQCKQIIPGQIWELGGSSDQNNPKMLTFQSCPTGAISVCTSTGSHRGLIEEYY